MLAATLALAALFAWFGSVARDRGVVSAPPVAAAAPALGASLVTLDAGAMQAVSAVIEPGATPEAQRTAANPAGAAPSDDAASPGTPSTRVTGRLVGGGVPLPDAAIELWRVRPREDGSTVEHAYATTRTDEYGAFALRDDVGGEHLVLRANGPGFHREERALPARGGAVRLEHDLGEWTVVRYGRVTGRVLLDPQLAERHEFAIAVRAGDVTVKRVPLAADGTFAFVPDRHGRYDIALAGVLWLGAPLALWEGVEVGAEDDELDVALGTADAQGRVVATSVTIDGSYGREISLASNAILCSALEHPSARERFYFALARDRACELVHAAPSAWAVFRWPRCLDQVVECTGAPVPLVLQRAPTVTFDVTFAGERVDGWTLELSGPDGIEQLAVEDGTALWQPHRLGPHAIGASPARGLGVHAPPFTTVDVAAEPLELRLALDIPPDAIASPR